MPFFIVTFSCFNPENCKDVIHNTLEKNVIAAHELLENVWLSCSRQDGEKFHASIRSMLDKKDQLLIMEWNPNKHDIYVSGEEGLSEDGIYLSEWIQGCQLTLLSEEDDEEF